MCFVEQIKILSKGSAYSALTIEKIEKHKIFFRLSLSKNHRQKLDELSTQTEKLEEIYKQKLTNLDELKKSVLKKPLQVSYSGILPSQITDMSNVWTGTCRYVQNTLIWTN